MKETIRLESGGSSKFKGMSKTQYFTFVETYDDVVSTITEMPQGLAPLKFYPCMKLEPSKVRSFINTNKEAYLLWTVIYYIFKN